MVVPVFLCVLVRTIPSFPVTHEPVLVKKNFTFATKNYLYLRLLFSILSLKAKSDL